jgi:hypothetical protein
MKNEEKYLRSEDGCRRGARRKMIERRNKKDDEKLIKAILVMYNHNNLSDGFADMFASR